MTDPTTADSPVPTSATTNPPTAASWTGGPFPPLWLAVLGSLTVVGQYLPAVCFVGALATLMIARRRPWVAAVAIVLIVWSGQTVLFTGRFLPWLG